MFLGSFAYAQDDIAMIKSFTIFYKSILVISLAALIFGAGFVNAAQLYFQPEQIGVPTDKPFTVTLLLNTEGESINTISGRVIVNKSLGPVETVTDSGSIITYWVQNPTLDQESNSVSFVGAIPGGYDGKTGILFSLVFPAYSGPKLDNAVLISEASALKNDGLGSSAEVTVKALELDLTTGAVDVGVSERLYVDDNKVDDTPPETFEPMVSRDDRVFSGKWFISFSTTDKQSGVDYYEVQESRSGEIRSNKWVRAESPYVLTDQKLKSYIYITAVDRQGNERVIQVAPQNKPSFLDRYGIAITIGLILLLIAGIIFKVSLKIHKQKLTDPHI